MTQLPRTRALLALAAVLILEGCGPGKTREGANLAPPAQIVLKVGSQKASTKSLLLASGQLQNLPYRIEWSEFPSAQTLLEALAAGAVDAGEVGDAPFQFAYTGGAKIKAILASRTDSGAAVALLSRAGSPIKTLADLRGKKIATGRGSIGHYLLLAALEKAGLSPKDVTIIFLSPADAKAAFNSGNIDVWSTWGSYIGFEVLRDQAQVIADGTGLITGYGFEAATDAAIQTKRAALSDFAHRLATAAAWQQTHDADWGAALSKETGLPADVANWTVSHYHRTVVPIDAAVVQTERDVLERFHRAGAIATVPDAAAGLDTSFNDAIKP